MLFAYNDDGTLEVLASQDDARTHFEGHDVESGAIRFFDADGRPMIPSFPKRSERRILGMRVSDDRGPFELAITNASDAESLEDALAPSSVMMPNRWFTDIDAVRAHLAAASDKSR